MTHQIQILYVDGCPNVDRAREVVRRSLLAAGLSLSGGPCCWEPSAYPQGPGARLSVADGGI